MLKIYKGEMLEKCWKKAEKYWKHVENVLKMFWKTVGTEKSNNFLFSCTFGNHPTFLYSAIFIAFEELQNEQQIIVYIVDGNNVMDVIGRALVIVVLVILLSAFTLMMFLVGARQLTVGMFVFWLQEWEFKWIWSLVEMLLMWW